MTRYSHAYSLAFEIVSEDPEGEDVTHEMLMEALFKRIASLTVPNPAEDLITACGCPWDTYEMDQFA